MFAPFLGAEEIKMDQRSARFKAIFHKVLTRQLGSKGSHHQSRAGGDVVLLEAVAGVATVAVVTAVLPVMAREGICRSVD